MNSYLKYWIIIIASLSSVEAGAQQEQMFTQFGFNKLTLNPGFAGNEDYLSFTGIYRDQWNGFPGAPDGQIFSADLPRLNETLGLGFYFQRQSIGITRSLSFTGNYSYKLRTDNFTIGLGLSTTFRNLALDFSDPRLVATDGLDIDGSIPEGRLNKSLMNVGFGTYMYNEKYFVGISVPGLIKSDLELGDDQDEIISQSNRHLFFMGGAALPINELLIFKPQFLMRWAENTPPSVDFNMGLLYQEKYNLALTYRTGGGDGDIGESIDVMMGVQLTDQVMIGIAQDFTLSALKQYDQGSIELLLHYRVVGSGPKKKIANPRFF